MDTVQKLEMLKEVYTADAELEQILEKLLDVTLDQQRSAQALRSRPA